MLTTEGESFFATDLTLVPKSLTESVTTFESSISSFCTLLLDPFIQLYPIPWRRILEKSVVKKAESITRKKRSLEFCIWYIEMI